MSKRKLQHQNYASLVVLEMNIKNIPKQWK